MRDDARRPRYGSPLEETLARNGWSARDPGTIDKLIGLYTVALEELQILKAAGRPVIEEEGEEGG